MRGGYAAQRSPAQREAPVSCPDHSCLQVNTHWRQLCSMAVLAVCALSNVPLHMLPLQVQPGVIKVELSHHHGVFLHWRFPKSRLPVYPFYHSQWCASRQRHTSPLCAAHHRDCRVEGSRLQ